MADEAIVAGEAAGFVVICCQKSVSFDKADHHFHRNTHDQELHEEICLGDKPKLPKEFLYLPGGALCAINPSWSMSTGQHGTAMAVFSGFLSNYAALVKQHWSAQLGLNVSRTPLEKLDALHPVTEAELICWMFAELGPHLLTKLQGNYSFCLYDSKLVRVLAARDPSGRLPLTEGRTEHDNLIVVSGPFKPANTTGLVDVAPGHYKYGWHAPHRPYPNSWGGSGKGGLRSHPLPQIPENGRAADNRRRSFDVGSGGRPHSVDRNRRHSLDGGRPAVAALPALPTLEDEEEADGEAGATEGHGEGLAPRPPRKRGKSHRAPRHGRGGANDKVNGDGAGHGAGDGVGEEGGEGHGHGGEKQRRHRRRHHGRRRASGDGGSLLTPEDSIEGSVGSLEEGDGGQGPTPATVGEAGRAGRAAAGWQAAKGEAEGKQGAPEAGQGVGAARVAAACGTANGSAIADALAAVSL